MGHDVIQISRGLLWGLCCSGRRHCKVSESSMGKSSYEVKWQEASRLFSSCGGVPLLVDLVAVGDLALGFSNLIHDR